MAENLIDLRRRIKSVKSTQKSTRAMKTVSAAKMRRSVMELNKTKPMMARIESLLKRVVGTIDVESHPLLQQRETGKTIFVVIAADKGLCGAYNSHLLAKGESYIQGEKNEAGDNFELIAVGKKAANHFSKRNFPIRESYRSMMTRLNHTHAFDLSKYLQELYTAEEGIGKIEFVFTEYRSASKQEITRKQLFPIESDWEGTTGQLDETENDVEYILEPSEEAIFNYLLPKYIDSLIYQVLLQSSASEHTARMIAMELATQNASEMIRNLTLTMNKLRQASITTELLEIITATEALNK